MPFNDPPWHPMTDAVDLKHIGKLAEEASELARICARIMIQGIDESDPSTGESNRLLIMNELADVFANADLCITRFKLSRKYMNCRMEVKQTNLRSWHDAA